MSLLAAVSPILVSTGGKAHEVAARQEVEGVAAILNGLHPGMTVAFIIAPLPPPGILLEGHLLSYHGSGFDAEGACRWTLPLMRLQSGVRYSGYLNGSVIVITAHG